MDDRPLGQNLTPPREHGWIPVATVTGLREVVARYLAGGHAAERLLIAIRELWREFAFSQHDRLQLAALYDRLVRRTIDRYYED